MTRVYLIGNGYVCNYITQMEVRDIQFVGVCRSEKMNCNINLKLDVSCDNEKIMSLIEDSSVVVYLAPPQQNGSTDLVLRNFLKCINKKKVDQIIYISTSGVYGDKNDRLVDENEPISPKTDRAKRRADAEEQIRSSDLDYTILRVPGIYGKDRMPLKRIEERLPLIKKEICKHTNLIHAKDLARIITACFHNKKTSKMTINVSDGCAIKTTDYYLHIYDFLNKPYPDFIDYEAANKSYDKKRLSFINESRILDTSLMDTIFPNIIEFKDVRDGIKYSLT
tara:strand:+ start:1237 stop:2076 length:840 start_codon:yes stop_codon:yes gene_type:complete